MAVSAPARNPVGRIKSVTGGGQGVGIDRSQLLISATNGFIANDCAFRHTKHVWYRDHNCDVISCVWFSYVFHFAEFYNFVLFVFNHCHGTKPHWLYIYAALIAHTNAASVKLKNGFFFIIKRSLVQQFPVNTLKEKTTKTNKKTYVKNFKLNIIYVDKNKIKKSSLRARLK